MKLTSALVTVYLGFAAASPVFRGPINHKHIARDGTPSLRKRQVPQEHSHDIVVNITREFLNLNNPKKIQDPVFGLLGDGAAAAGAGSVTNLACLKQETADQAFTNAKAAGDLRGMAGSLLFQAIERNTAGVSVASKLCTDKAANPEIAALTQHQDAASDNAGALNKAVTLELAKQLAGIGADPNLALLSGTFAPGSPDDSTGKGNSCDDEEPDLGCIFSKNLLVLDAKPEEISSAVANVAQTFTGTGGIFATDLVDLASFSVAAVTGAVDLATVVNGASAGGAGGAATSAAAVSSAVANNSKSAVGGAKNAGKGCAAKSTTAAASAIGAVSSGGSAITTTIVPDATSGTATQATNAAGNGQGVNVQSFTGTLGGPAPPVVSSTGDRPFSVNGNTFTGIGAALGRSCDIQHNACANAANSGQLSGGVAQCESQNAECRDAASAAQQ
ncbi:hypothetical protein ACHAPJ_011850 [Fusarium lateritium]